MKNIKMILAGLFIAIAAFGFFGCSDTEDDDDLVVTISNSSDNLVTIIAPDEYSGKNVVIIYTTDGTSPKIENVKADTSKSTGYSADVTGTEYEGPFSSTVGTTIKARGYYVDTTKTPIGKYQGPVATYTVKTVEAAQINATETVNEATGASSGKFTFALASTGNSMQTHYFDTSSSNVFKLNEEHAKAYYQTQFSWTGTGKGHWYLYMRDVGGGIIKLSDDSKTNFLAKGSYTGDCFNALQVKAGSIVLKDSDGNDAGTLTISNDAFTMYVTNSTAASGTLGTFTVSDAK